MSLQLRLFGGGQIHGWQTYGQQRRQPRDRQIKSFGTD